MKKTSVTYPVLQSIPLSQLNTAHYNYKLDNKATMKSLRANMKKNGQVIALIVRELGKSKYEVINGNHRYEAMLSNGETEAVCLNLGTIDLVKAKRIALETNETEFASDSVKLADIIKELSEEFDFEDLENTMPFSKAELKQMNKLTSFEEAAEDDDSYEEESNENFELDKPTPKSKPKKEESVTSVLEFLMSVEARDSFQTSFQILKERVASKKVVGANDDAALSFLTKLINRHVENRENK